MLDFIRNFFMLNHYIYAIKTQVIYIVESSSWLFTYNLDWNDYFENIQVNGKYNYYFGC